MYLCRLCNLLWGSSTSIFIHSFIHSVIYLRTGPRALPKLLPQPVPHTVRASASSLILQYPLVSLTSFSIYLGLLLRLLVTSILPSIFPSITCFIRQFLRQLWPIHLAFLLFTVYRIFLSSLTIAVILRFSHSRSNWSSPYFSSTTFQIFPSMYVLPEVSNFPAPHKEMSKSNTSLFSSLDLSPIWLWKQSSSYWSLLLPWQS